MIVLTGATGVVGSALLRRLLAQGEPVRVLVRDPRRLGPDRVRVQIALGDLSNPVALRQLVRGAHTVVHLAATIRDQPGAGIAGKALVDGELAAEAVLSTAMVNR